MGILQSLISNGLRWMPATRRTRAVDIALEYLPEITYSRLAKAGFEPAAIVDIGAYRGEWTRIVASAFPKTPILMIEAQEHQKPYLLDVAREIPDAQVKIGLLGSRDDEEVPFNIMGRGSSIYNERSNIKREMQSLKSATLDTVIREAGFAKYPLFLKLDVQGAELDILRGGSATLQAAEVVQLETALTHYNEGAPKASDVIAFMAQNNFHIYDIASFVRPHYPCLSQIDLVFAKEGSKLRRDYFAFDAKHLPIS